MFSSYGDEESPLDSKEIKPVNPKGNKHEYSCKGLMMEPKLQYFGHLMQRADLLEKILMLEKIHARGEEGHRGICDWMTSLTQWTCSHGCAQSLQ